MHQSSTLPNNLLLVRNSLLATGSSSVPKNSLDPSRLLAMAMDHDKGDVFGQKRPPLSVTIKQILERYPDGQIFKVGLI